MNQDQLLIEQQQQLLARLIALTANGSLQWEKQQDSAHYFVNWDGILLILGPKQSSRESKTASYLHILPLFSVKWMEINSHHPELHNSLQQLINAVEAALESQPPANPIYIRRSFEVAQQINVDY